MRLSQKQRAFTRACMLLEQFAHAMGYELTDGDAFRDHRVHGKPGEKRSYSSRWSNHKYRLARDYNLFIDGRYQTATEVYRPLGEFWEYIGPPLGLDLVWGGHESDGNHFSCRHRGRW